MEQILYEELHIMPLAKRHILGSLDSTNSDLNDFLKNDALQYQEDMVSRTHLCC